MPSAGSRVRDRRCCGDIPLSGVVVFGISHVEKADEVVAVLERREHGRAPDEIVEQVAAHPRNGGARTPDQVVVTPPGTIPRTTSGKVRRAETRARFQAGTLLTKPVAAATTQTDEPVRQAATHRRARRRRRRRGPPDGLIGSLPSLATTPSAMTRAPCPSGVRPIASYSINSAMVKQSCTSANDRSVSPRPACASARCHATAQPSNLRMSRFDIGRKSCTCSAARNATAFSA